MVVRDHILTYWGPSAPHRALRAPPGGSFRPPWGANQNQNQNHGGGVDTGGGGGRAVIYHIYIHIYIYIYTYIYFPLTYLQPKVDRRRQVIVTCWRS